MSNASDNKDDRKDERAKADRTGDGAPRPQDDKVLHLARPAPAGKSAPSSSLRRKLLFALLPLALLIGGYIYVTGGAIMSTDNAYIQADMVGVTTDVSGIVRDVDVHDNQRVAAGTVLFKLDDLPFRLALERAQAQLGSTANDLRALQTNYRNAQTQIAQAKTDVDYYTINFKRAEGLLAAHTGTQVTYDDTHRALQNAQQKLTGLEQQLAGVAANLNGEPDAPIEDHPRYKEALAVRDEAARQLAHTVVRAPFAGIVTNVPALQPGQYLAAAATAFNIVSTDHMWVEASPKETELTYVRPGQTATVTVDMYPGEQWTGTVESISPASASSFSLLPAENSSGNWVKVVQRIPMRVHIDNAPDKPPLRVGMSVVLNVDTKHARGFPLFSAGLSSPAAGAERE
jgi:membrane fusion protein, multidrug efflux system